MDYQVKGVTIEYDRKSKIYIIGEFITRKCQYLEIFLEIYKIAKKASNRDAIISNVIDEAVLRSVIDKNAGKRLNEIVKMFYMEDEKKKGKVSGELFEFIFWKVIPLGFNVKNRSRFSIEKRCVVEHIEVGVIGTHNFDLGFYKPNCSLVSDFICELLECKADLNNFIISEVKESDTVTLKIKHDAAEKLDYMMEIYRRLQGYNAVIGLATPYYGTDAITLLEDNGYKNIIIFGPQEIINAYKKLKKCS